MKRIVSAAAAAAAMIITAAGAAAVGSSWRSDDEVTALLSELNIMNGDGSGNFNLDGRVTRAEMAKLAVASSERKDTVALGLKFSPFSDVPGSFWGAPYIRSAVDAGIVEGYMDGSFKPEGEVTYEEAVTMMLKVLGYTSADFGASYPYGQLGTAQGLNLTDGMNGQIGEPVTRRQAAVLICNALEAKKKDGQELISVHDCSIIEDVTIIAAHDEDSSLSSDEISTTSGKYKIDDSFQSSYIGCRGDMVVRNGKYFVAFAADGSESSEKYIVYSTLNDAVLCYPEGNNSTIKQLDISDTAVCYKNSQAYTYGTLRQQMEMGDVIRVRYKDNGEIDYINYSEGSLEGPIKVTSAEWMRSFETDSATKIMRDGKKASESDVQINDIIYYSRPLNMVLAYTNRATGVYEQALPSKDQPQTVVISGVSYEVEGAEAFNALSSSGSVHIGDTVTVLFGRDGKSVAGVAANDIAAYSSQIGYVTASGKKEFVNADNTTYTSYFITMVTPDGGIYTYPTAADKSSTVNKAARADIKNGIAEVNIVSGSGGLSGSVSYAGKRIGARAVADNVNIIDVAKNPYSDTALYTKTYMQRIDGLELAADKVLYYETNSNDEISALILMNVTGDMYQYGMVTSHSTVSVGNDGESNVSAGRYVIESSGSTYTITGARLTKGVPAQFAPEGTEAGYAQQLKAYTGTVEELAASYAVIGGRKYLLSDKVKVFRRSGDKYLAISVNEAVNGDYEYTCYYDKPESEGGRIRVITVSE